MVALALDPRDETPVPAAPLAAGLPPHATSRKIAGKTSTNKAVTERGECRIDWAS
jgi:hypothetical protein